MPRYVAVMRNEAYPRGEGHAVMRNEAYPRGEGHAVMRNEASPRGGGPRALMPRLASDSEVLDEMAAREAAGSAAPPGLNLAVRWRA